MHLLKNMMEFINSKESLKDLILLKSEGIDEVNYKIFETKHPF